MAIFDILSPELFFYAIKRRFIRYQASRVKSTEDLLFIIMGLNHLREWIAPGYEKGKNGAWPPTNTPEQEFSRKVYGDSDHEVIRELCNGMKHVKVRNPKHTTSAAHDSTFDEWPNVDDVREWDKGPPTEHLVDEESIGPKIQRVIDLYETWFTR